MSINVSVQYNGGFLPDMIATPFDVDESKESLYGREMDRDMRSACRCVT